MCFGMYQAMYSGMFTTTHPKTQLIYAPRGAGPAKWSRHDEALFRDHLAGP